MKPKAIGPARPNLEGSENIYIRNIVQDPDASLVGAPARCNLGFTGCLPIFPLDPDLCPKPRPTRKERARQSTRRAREKERI